MKADPTSAAAAEVAPGRSIEDMEATLVGRVPADRIDFLTGDGAITFLDDLLNRLSRLVSQTWHDVRGSLASGKVLLGMFDAEVDAGRIRALLPPAGVRGIRSPGTWTWSGQSARTGNRLEPGKHR
jgi:hypothetical protein